MEAKNHELELTLSKTINEMNQKLPMAQELIQTKSNEIQTLNSEIKLLQDSINSLTKENEELTKSVIDEKQKSQKLQEQLTNLETALQSYQQIVEGGKLSLSLSLSFFFFLFSFFFFLFSFSFFFFSF